jgi:hypothetical protein
MKKVALIFISALFLTSCMGTKELPMYNWGSYSDDFYKYIKQNTPEAQEKFQFTLTQLLDATEKTKRQVPPPGICADCGYLLIMNGKTDEGIALLEKEKSLYPESSKLIDSVLNRLKNN